MGLIGNISLVNGAWSDSAKLAEPGNVMQILSLPKKGVGCSVMEVVVFVFPKFNQNTEVVTNV